jgi:long-chain acyl-CoA synthetase
MPFPNMPAQLASVVARVGDRTAVEVQRRGRVDRFTYAELERMAGAAARMLASAGVKAGDRAVVVAENDAHWCAAYLGALRLGAVAVPFDTSYKPAQVAKLVADCGAAALFVSPHHLETARAAIAASRAAPPILLLRGREPGLPSLEDWIARSSPDPLPPCPAGSDDPAVILYTSGTTSDPKGVVLTHRNLIAESEAVFEVVHIDERDCVLGVLPLFHALAQMANLLLPFSVGARVVFLESVNTTELLHALQERGVTAFCCVPQFFYLIHQRVLQQVEASGAARRLAFRALLAVNGVLRERASVNLGPRLFRRVHDVLGRDMRLLVTGGSRFDPRIGRDLYRLGFNILQAYGLTECAGAATVTRPGDVRLDAVGHPLPGVDVRTLPPEGAGEDGEILIRGPIVMSGYYQKPEATASTLRDGWLYTGDLGRLDASGRLYITGRRKEVIVLSSGKNIYPEEIEAHYLQSPLVKELCVMGLAREDEPAAERLFAAVVPDVETMRQRKVVNMREAIRFEIEGLSVHLPSHKRILGYEIWTEDLPRTTTRKLKRFEIERKVRASATQTGAARATASADEEAWAAEPANAAMLAAISELAGVERIGPNANLELDLGLDSMERVELLTGLEHRFATDVPNEVAQHIYTVRELVDALRAHGNGGASAGEGIDAWDSLLAGTAEDDPVLSGLLAKRTLLAAVMFAIVRIWSAAARLFFRFEVSGREHLPAKGPFLLCPNHESYLDPFFLVTALPFGVFRNLFFVGASEYFATPFMQRVARLVNIVPVDPDANLLRAMQAGAYGLRHGKILILFPEGERSIDGDVKRFKKGASILSAYLGAPVVPVAFRGLFTVWPRQRSFNWRAIPPFGRARVQMRIGKPLAPPVASGTAAPAWAGVGGAALPAQVDHGRVAEHLRSVVAGMWEQMG